MSNSGDNGSDRNNGKHTTKSDRGGIPLSDRGQQSTPNRRPPPKPD